MSTYRKRQFSNDPIHLPRYPLWEKYTRVFHMQRTGRRELLRKRFTGIKSRRLISDFGCISK